EQAAPMQFLGVEWYPIPYDSDGWGMDGMGGTPRPTITLADFDAILMYASAEYQDLIKAQVTKYETTLEHVDSGEFYGPEIWLINKKMASNGKTIKFQLATPADQKN